MEPWASEVIWIVVLSFVVSFLLAFGVGANDVANSFGTSVGSRALSLRTACILATVFEVAGAILIGQSVLRELHVLRDLSTRVTSLSGRLNSLDVQSTAVMKL